MASTGTPSRMPRSGSTTRLTQIGSAGALPAPSVAGVALASGLLLSCILSVLFVAGLPTRSLISNDKPTTWSALVAPERCSASELASLSNNTSSVAGCGEKGAQKGPEGSPDGPASTQQVGAVLNVERSEPSSEERNAAAETDIQANLAQTRSESGSQEGPPVGREPAPAGSSKDFLYHAVPITVLPDTETSGVCLDGSPPAYHMRRGRGSGASKWVVFLEGGGWCTGAADCRKRARSRLGSSQRMSPEALFGGILSNSSYWNPLFHDWNTVFVRYCDGASFAGTLGPKDGVTTDGQRVFERVVRHLLQAEGMRHATHALLAGCSAGGLAALLHCDQFKSLLVAGSAGPGTQEGPSDVSRDHAGSAQWSQTELAESRGRRLQEGRTEGGPMDEDDLGMGRREPRKEEMLVVKCLSDAGYFPDIESVMGRRTLRQKFAAVVAFHRPLLSAQCTAATGTGDGSPGCFFAENFIKFIETPTFFLNPLYDLWTIRHAAIPGGLDLPWEWLSCRQNIEKCSEEQLSHLHLYRGVVVDKLRSLLDATGKASAGGRKPIHGVFLDSCPTHGQAAHTLRWNGEGAPRVNNRTMAQAVASWYNEEDQPMASYDCPYPCNPTCYPNAFKY